MARFNFPLQLRYDSRLIHQSFERTGALVGGASLKPEFAEIIKSAEEAYKTKARL